MHFHSVIVLKDHLKYYLEAMKRRETMELYKIVSRLYPKLLKLFNNHEKYEINI